MATAAINSARTHASNFTLVGMVKSRYSTQAFELTKYAKENANSDSFVKRHVQAPLQLFLAGVAEVPYGIAKAGTSLFDAPVHLVRGKFSEAGKDLKEVVKAIAYTVLFAVAALVVAVAALVFPRQAFKAVGEGVESPTAQLNAEIARLKNLVGTDKDQLIIERDAALDSADALQETVDEQAEKIADLEARLARLESQQTALAARVEDSEDEDSEAEPVARGLNAPAAQRQESYSASERSESSEGSGDEDDDVGSIPATQTLRVEQAPERRTSSGRVVRQPVRLGIDE